MSFSKEHVWDKQLDQLAEEMLQAGGCSHPPINAIQLAQNLQIVVAVDASQTTRARHKQIRAQPAIFLEPDERPERMQWAAAHELGETIAWDFFQRIECDSESNSNLAEQREQMANLFAARILLPHASFFSDAQTCDDNLISLKTIYSTASFELIAMRLLDRPTPLVVTIFDHNILTRRRGNSGYAAPPLQALEKHCQQTAHQQNQYATYSNSELSVQCFPVHQPDWKREILLCTPLYEE